VKNHGAVEIDSGIRDRQTRLENTREKTESLHAISLGYGPNVMGSCNGASNRCFLVRVGQTLSSKVGGATLRNLNDDRSFDIPNGRDDDGIGARK
jgi:hypothetical protein